jgi:hypothetical protein
LQHKSDEASSSAGETGGASSTASSGVSAQQAPATTAHVRAPATKPLGSAAASSAYALAVLQGTLASELKQGKVLLLLFWNPRSTDDVSVRDQLNAVSAKLKGKVAVHVALPEQVGQYGAITRNVQIFGTPSLVVVGRHGEANTLTGLVDAYAIEQAVSEARQASGNG